MHTTADWSNRRKKSVSEHICTVVRQVTWQKTLFYILILGTVIIMASNFVIESAVRRRAGPCSFKDPAADSGREGVPMNVLISGDSSLVRCRLARRLLRDGHRVTLMQHIDQELRVPANDSRVITDLLGELIATGEQFSIRHTTTCKPVSVSQHAAPGTSPFSHVVFITTALQGSESPSAAFVRHSLQCLSSLLEGTKLDNPRPIFTLVFKAHDAVGELYSGNANVMFDSVIDSAMEIVLYTYWSLYNTSVIHVKLPPDVDRQISTASSEASLVVEKVTSSIVVAMQKRSCSDDIHVVEGVNNYWGLSHQQLMPRTRLLSWNASSHSPEDTSVVEGEDIVLTTYLTSKKDPQRNIFTSTNSYNYVSKWHLSMRNIGIKAVVFHDGLTPEFRERLQPEVTFQDISPGKLSLNDDRYFHFLRYIESRPNIKHILFSDISDVVFLRNPFELMRLLGDHLYIGDDMKGYPLVGSLPWTVNKITSCFGNGFNNKRETKSLAKFSVVYNAGIIGGPRHIILRFLRQLTAVLSEIDGNNCNTAAVNYIAHKYFDDVTFCGFPLTSKYKDYENKMSGTYLIHK